MELAADVTVDGETRRVSLGLALAEPDDVAIVSVLVGADAVSELTRDGWNAEAAKAIIYVNLMRELSDGDLDWTDPPYAWGDFELDWGHLTPFMEPDEGMESSLAELQS